MTIDRAAAEEFLYHEADLLDRWDLETWLDLFATPCEYLVPPPGVDDPDPDRDSFLVHDDRLKLEQRVASLLKRSAHAEWPHSRTRRLITNVRVAPTPAGAHVTANFMAHRIRAGQLATFIGRYDHDLVDDGGIHFRRRIAVLDLDALRPEGKLSIIL